MPSDKNIQQVKTISEQLNQAAGVVVVGYKGLTHRQMEDLRNELKEIDNQMQVVKNSLFKLAVADYSPFSEEINETLDGPVAVLFLNEDFVSPIKKLVDFSEQAEQLSIKIALIDGVINRKDDILKIAKLPSYEELMSKLIGQIQAPIQNLVYVLNAPLQNLTYAINAIGSTKGGESSG